MKITNAKLIKGTNLEVSFIDGNAVVDKSYPHTEAPPKLGKAFQALNSHLCDLTEQCDSTGQPDYDNTVCRGYSIKGEGEKMGVVLTGVRTLKTGQTITLNSPFTMLDISESSYQRIKVLVEALDRCRDEIKTFMENNKAADEIQGKLALVPPENVILKSKDNQEGWQDAEELTKNALNGEEVDVTHLYKPKEQQPEKKPQTQAEMDAEMPLHISKMTDKQLKALNTPEATEELQRRNAEKNKKK